MRPSRLTICLAAALAFAQFAVAQAAEIPAKYRGVYASGDNCSIPEQVGEFPWLVVTDKSIYAHETFCSVIAVQRNVRSNVDRLTFRCSAEGMKSTEKEDWSLELETKQVHCCKMSQPYLSKRSLGPGEISSGGGRLKKCGLQAVPLP